MNKNQGFTIIEIICTLCIIGIIAAVAAPNTVTWILNTRLNGSAREIHAVIQFARLTAIKENANTIVNFSQGNNNYSVFVDNGAGANAGNRTQDDDEPTIKTGVFPDGVHRTTSDGISIKFNARGFPSPLTTISITNSIKTKDVIISFVGHSRIR
jgi:prepilin-type N-terminal cleavage/methylation domain-containing protein